MVATREEKRAYLDVWAGENHGDAEGMARDHPDCACEEASPTEGGHGPVADAERLRCFIVSWIDIDLKKASPKPFNSAILKKIFKDGKSSVRIDRAKAGEIELSASIIHKNLANKDPKHGGIMGVIDFTAARVRYLDDGERVCCVFDTPYHPDRPSHSDIVFAAGQQPQDEEEARKVRVAIFNRIGGTQAFTGSADVKDCNLSPFLPQKIKPTD
jgi:hypothetical protein